MKTTVELPYTDEQISAWLRGLLTVAWADGYFDPEEQELIAKLTQDELAPTTDLGSLEPITPEELVAKLGKEQTTAENFLRTAVMMALANGVYSKEESDIVHRFQEALGLDIQALKSLEKTCYDLAELSSIADEASQVQPDVLKPVREWLDGIDISDPRVARFVCKMVPSQCPFERDITLFGRKIVHIPPMCKLNPLYEQLVGLRFRSLSFLADDCGEDVSQYV